MDALSRMQQRNRNLFGTEDRVEVAVNNQVVSKPRKIQFQKAGAFFRVRFAGRSTNIFWSSRSESQTMNRLKFFDGGTQ